MSPLNFVLTVLLWLRAAALVTLALLVVVMLMHTVELLGHKTVLYKHREPVPGWSARFYPACGGLILVLIVLIWFITAHAQQFFTDNLL